MSNFSWPRKFSSKKNQKSPGKKQKRKMCLLPPPLCQAPHNTRHPPVLANRILCPTKDWPPQLNNAQLNTETEAPTIVRVAQHRRRSSEGLFPPGQHPPLCHEGPCRRGVPLCGRRRRGGVPGGAPRGRGRGGVPHVPVLPRAKGQP